MRLEVKLGGVVAGVFFIFLDYDLSFRKREPRLCFFRGGWTAIDEICDPFVKPGLQGIACGEAADFVADHALQVMGETAGSKQVRKPGSEISIRGRIRIIVGL